MVPARKTRTAHNNVERFHNIFKNFYRRPYKRSNVRQLTLKKSTLETGLVGARFNRIYRVT
jgi:hypothetical protein